MSAVTAQDVSEWSERESLYVFVGAATKSASKRIIGFVFLPILIIFAAILAQLYPYSMRKTMRELSPRLPYVDDPEVLGVTRDALKLALSAGRFYAPVCLSRHLMREALDEIDEAINSIEVVLECRGSLEELATEGARRLSPDLPLGLADPPRQLEIA